MSSVASDITEEMLEAGYRAMCYSGNGGRTLVREILGAALAGRTVVELPEPDSADEDGDAAWEAPGVTRRLCVIGYLDGDGEPQVTDGDSTMRADDAQRYALAKFAAARWACRLASGSVGSETPEPTDDYWTPEPVQNEAVAEWASQQPELRKLPRKDGDSR